MAEESGEKEPEREPPGFWACKRVLARLRRYQDLVRQHDRYGTDLDQARPLEELIPDVPKDGYQRVEAIEREIHRLTVLVSSHLDLAGVSTGIMLPAEGPGDTDKKRDLVREYLSLPSYGGRYHGLLMTAIEEGIGVYENIKSGRKREMWNPLRWIAWVLRVPVTILEYASLIRKGEASVVLKVYIGLVQTLWAAILGLGAGKLGLSQLWPLIRDAFR